MIVCRVLHSLCAILLAVFLSPEVLGSNLAHTVLYNGDRNDELMNRWGGVFTDGNTNGVTRDTSVALSGDASLRVDLGSFSPGGFRFFQTFSSQLASQDSRQTRDLTRYDNFSTQVRNTTGVPLNFEIELKDYRDSVNHRAIRSFTLPAGSSWTDISTSLDIGSAGWSVSGSPDLERTYAVSFLVTAAGSPVSGSIYLDDLALTEAGGAIDIQTAPIETIAERLAERQFSGLWQGRNRTTGMIYNSSDNANLAAMNTLAGVLWMLPAAVDRGWVSQSEADGYVTQVVGSLDTVRDQTQYVPSRFMGPLSLTAGSEESSIDASFVALALHHYKNQPTTSPALANSIDALQNRFDLASFAVPSGFRLAYFSNGSGFTPGTYDGYTNEGKVISLAAELSDSFHVPLEDLWNSDTFRSRESLVNADDAHLVHSIDNFRAPFEQALLNLFVDTSERGVDNYPDRSLATNPWQNYVRYQREVSAKLEELGRESFFQPDAGFDVPSSDYQQYSLYNDFGRPDLFMPWSTAFALLTGADGAEEALRVLLENDLHGPLGLADTARWTTGAAEPSFVPSFQDNWNVVLSTMALLEFLDGADSASGFFAGLPEVASALDEVFVDGDLTGDGVTDDADLAILLAGFGTPGGATPAGGDTDGDGDVDVADLMRWQRGAAVAGALSALSTVPEPGGAVLALVLAAVMAGSRRCSLHRPL